MSNRSSSSQLLLESRKWPEIAPLQLAEEENLHIVTSRSGRIAVDTMCPQDLLKMSSLFQVLKRSDKQTLQLVEVKAGGTAASTNRVVGRLAHGKSPVEIISRTRPPALLQLPPSADPSSTISGGRPTWMPGDAHRSSQSRGRGVDGLARNR